jgi:hypothetical protein
MSKKTKRRIGAREQFWRRVIGKRLRSGLTIRAFCDREGLTESAYHFWRRELLKRDGRKQRTAARGRQTSMAVQEVRAVPTFASLTLGDASSEMARVSSIEPSMAIEIVLRDNVRVRVGRGVDLQLLHQVLGVMEHRSC